MSAELLAALKECVELAARLKAQLSDRFWVLGVARDLPSDDPDVTLIREWRALIARVEGT